jgi:methylated-DNA-protein-cysteine methyltransferase-like protein
MKELSDFSQKVIDRVAKIPRGKVATYKQIAELCGKPLASRGVAWILNSCSKKYKLPWHRVINSKGRISFKPMTRNYRLQQLKLRGEGVKFMDNDDIDMARFQWAKKPAKARRRKGQPHMFRD